MKYYDDESWMWKSYCTKCDCSHYDENCFVWIGEENARIAMKGGVCYYIGSENGVYGLVYFEFGAMNPVTLICRSYYKVQAQENEEIYLDNAALCSDTAILIYSVRMNKVPTMQLYIQAFDLQTGKIITVMNREVQNGEVYELWSMNENHIIVSYLHEGANNSFAAVESSFKGLPNHTDFMMNQHRWVLLEFPIKENAAWSEQIVQYAAGSDLRLLKHSNFYRGTLYYVLNDTVRGYDLQEHKSAKVFEQKGIVYMSCLDGKILYLTDKNRCFGFDLESGTTQEIEQTEYFPLAESENCFYCKKVSADDYFETECIQKSEYYAP